jgi:hypothetical protein
MQRTEGLEKLVNSPGVATGISEDFLEMQKHKPSMNLMGICMVFMRGISVTY